MVDHIFEYWSTIPPLCGTAPQGGQGTPLTSALSLAVVLTPRGERHAVLVLSTDRGDYVLDSLTPWIVPWRQSGYRWLERQVAGARDHWVMVADPANGVQQAQSNDRETLIIAL